MKRLRWLSHGTAWLVALIALNSWFLSDLGFSQCDLFLGDDFNDNTKDPTKWGPDFHYFPGHALLNETNGRLEFTSATPAPHEVSRLWIWTGGSYISDWEVQANFNLGGVLPGQSNWHVAYGLKVVTSNAVSGQCYFVINLEAGGDGTGQVVREFSTYFATNSVLIRANTNHLTKAVSAGLRLGFDSAAKTLRLWCDEDGGKSGYSWTSLRSARIDANGYNWGMTDQSTFEIIVGGDSVGTVVTSTNEVFLDNLAWNGPPCYSKFIHAARKPDGSFQVIWEGNGRYYDLEATTNLANPASVWRSIATLTNDVTGKMEHIDSKAANHASCFYRALSKEP